MPDKLRADPLPNGEPGRNGPTKRPGAAPHNRSEKPIYTSPGRAPLLVFSLSSLALFAFWLRSSVVSVLFSLISERSLRRPIVIILIFGLGEKSSVLAHDSSHSVPGITLPPGDANTFFIVCSGLTRDTAKKRRQSFEFKKTRITLDVHNFGVMCVCSTCRNCDNYSDLRFHIG
ncbi:uncharacterized protein CTRU02_205846 [Colletotrichum truncatum]|uniref:Uncharacterized protein n=1 Tax=Colletotrichum truncatum TaxID=5467 RepID=A0ACC3Z559_COLTU